MRSIITSVLLAITCVTVFSQEDVKFKVLPTARVLIDGALYASPQKELFKDGMAIPEARLGMKMSYGKWFSWIDMGFAYGKIGLRNMWVEYSFDNKNSVRVGNFIQPFGLMSTTTMSVKSTFEAPLAAMPFTPGIQLGAMYTFNNKHFLSSSAFHVESSALTNVMNYPQFSQQGYTLLTRDVWRMNDPLNPEIPTIQIGTSLGFSTPERRLEGDTDIHDGFSLTANYPTKVTTLQAVGATVANSKNLFKIAPELLAFYKKVAIEANYFYQQINRRNGLSAYKAQGGFVTLRGMLTGGDYTYNYALGYVNYPNKNALEWTLDYNYITLTDRKAGVFGGRANSFNITLNYYFNPYITARLNYTFTHTWDREGYMPTTLNGFQLRLMVLF